MQDPEEKIIRLCGREFSPIGQSVPARQDDYLMGHLRRAGVIDVILEMKDAEAEVKSSELLTRILLSGRAPFILAGAPTEVGKKRTREDAERNAEAFAQTSDPGDKATMRSSIVAFVLGFFLSAPRSSTSSPSSSTTADPEALPTASAEAGTSETLQ
jgi:hypothetical protein